MAPTSSRLDQTYQGRSGDLIEKPEYGPLVGGPNSWYQIGIRIFRLIVSIQMRRV